MGWQELDLAWEPDAGWVEVPDDPDLDTGAWAVQTLRTLADDRVEAVDELRLQDVATALALYADAARDPGSPADVAWVYVPDPLSLPLATCHLDLLEVVPGEVPDLDELERALGQPQDDHLEPPVVSRRLLPSGWAVRQQLLRSDEPGGEDVQEVVTWAVLLPGVDDALLRLTTTWRALTLGEELAEQADRMAAGLEVSARTG